MQPTDRKKNRTAQERSCSTSHPVERQRRSERTRGRTQCRVGTADCPVARGCCQPRSCFHENLRAQDKKHPVPNDFCDQLFGLKRRSDHKLEYLLSEIKCGMDSFLDGQTIDFLSIVFGYKILKRGEVGVCPRIANFSSVSTVKRWWFYLSMYRKISHSYEFKRLNTKWHNIRQTKLIIFIFTVKYFRTSYTFLIFLS